MRQLSVIALFAMICISATAAAPRSLLAAKAQTNPDRETLVGLRAVRVIVEELRPEFEQAGVAKEQVQTDVELRLRKAGIRVIDFGSTYLYININSIRDGDYSSAYSIDVQLNQPVLLERDKSISCIATTWDRGTIEVIPNSRLQTIRDSVGNLVDMFINDFLAASSTSSTQNQSPQVSKDAPRIDSSDAATPTNESPETQDYGVDVAYVTAVKANLREQPDSANIVVQPERGDLLALIDRKPRGTWYNVIHVRTGKEGWIDQSVISIRYTRNPRPAPVFEESRVEDSKDPELAVTNQTDRLLSLRLGNSLYTIPANSARSFTVPAGTYKFYASVPNAFPTLGEKYFPKGIVYRWRFYIVTTRR